MKIGTEVIITGPVLHPDSAKFIGYHGTIVPSSGTLSPGCVTVQTEAGCTLARYVNVSMDSLAVAPSVAPLTALTLTEQEYKIVVRNIGRLD
jgi:hypothetical protein